MRAYALLGLLGLASAVPALPREPEVLGSLHSWLEIAAQPLKLSNDKASVTITSLNLTHAHVDFANNGDLDIEWTINEDDGLRDGRLLWQARPTKDQRSGNGTVPKSDRDFWFTTTIY